MTSYKQRAWWIRSGIALVGLCLALGLEWGRPAVLRGLDEGIRDLVIRTMASSQPDHRVAVVDIDEQSLAELGPWPWSRARIADLIESLLLDQHVKVVGLDIVFPQPADPVGDARVAALVAHTPVTVAQILDYTGRTYQLNQGLLTGGVIYNNASGAATAQGYIANHEGIAKARCVGNIGYLPDRDGTLRHIPTQTVYEGRLYQSLSQAMLACANNRPLRAEVPANENGLWRIPYRTTQDAYTVVTAADLILQRIPANTLSGRYVLIGSSGLSLGDHVITPLAPLTAGVMVHAAAISGLLDLQQGLDNTPTSGRDLLLVWCLATFSLTVWLIPRLSAWMGTSLVLVECAAWLALACFGAFDRLEWSITAPLWGYAIFLVIAIPFEWWQAQKHTRQLMNTLSHYVARPVLEEIVRRDLQHSLEPSLKNVTVLVADMEGYTRLTSAMSLKMAATLTKTFLDRLTRPVLEHGGTLDKYSGDGLVAFWGAPLPCEDQADTAISAALEIIQEIQKLNERKTDFDASTISVRIGIESGLALVGDLGTDFRSTYTAVGDCINFASRLESAAKNMGTPLLLGPAVSREIKNHELIQLNSINLRNTNTTLEVFTLRSLIK
jgi:adenylate cyclase